MAIAATLSGDWLESAGSRRAVNGQFVLSGNYATGGYAITAAMIGLGVIDFLDVEDSSLGFMALWDKTNSKILLYQSTTGAPLPLVEVANATAVSSTIQFRAIGR